MKKIFLVLTLLLCLCLGIACGCDHEYGKWVTVPATCSQEGQMTRECSKCGDVNKIVLPKTEHEQISYEIIDDTTHKKSCTCGYEEVEKHFNEGEEASVCLECGYSLYLSNNQIKDLIVTTITSYRNSLTGSLSVSLINGKNTQDIKLDYILKSANEVSAFGYHVNEKRFDIVNGEETEYNLESYAYVKGDYLYHLANGELFYDEMASDVTDELLKNCAPFVLIRQCAKYYSENAFYNALKLEKFENNKYEFVFDLIEYQGNTINVTGKTEIRFNVVLDENILKQIELISISEEKTTKAIVTFNGLTAPTINYPDFSSLGIE